MYVKNTDYGETHNADNNIPDGYVAVMQGDTICGIKSKNKLNTTFNLDKYKCICSVMPGAVSTFDKNGKVLGMFKISIIKPDQVPKGSFPVLRYFDTEHECESYISFMECKLCAFLYYLGCCGTTLTREFFRFIPDPGRFDHIFTDEELYQKYNLTQEEINIIESIIKERK